jgi:tetratricopeptide (TPR) repeat protein
VPTAKRDVDLELSCTVMSVDWYRNTTWNDSVERVFNEKLDRARRKEQYLRIQACTLARSHPEVALRLLDRYFALKDDFDHAQAFVDRATAFVTLGRIDEAIDSYNSALAREAEFPNLLTQAHLDLPYLIAVRGIRTQYDHAIRLLEKHRSRLMFPVDQFRWHAALALIAADVGQTALAKREAADAVSAAAVDHSGFRYHPTVGLVTEKYDELMQKLSSIIGG